MIYPRGTPPYLVLLKGGPDFTSETVIAYELGYRVQLNSKFTASVSSFYNQYDDVRSTSITPLTIVPLFFANNVTRCRTVGRFTQVIPC